MRRIHIGWLIVLAGILPGTASAQAPYPTRPVRLIVPFPPGGGADTLARAVSQKLSDVFRQQVVMDNRPGAGSNIGVELAAKSPPDGYTLLLATISTAIAATLYSKLNYDLIRDFAPVTLLATQPLLLTVHPSLPVKSVKELIALAKARPGQLAYSSAGNGTPTHLAAELFGYMTNAKMTHVPYRGAGPAAIALIGGEVPVSIASMASVIAHVKSGKLRGLAVSTAQRSPSTPDIPTISEAGVPGYDVSAWYGLLAPAGTPKEIIARLNAETAKLLKLTDVKQLLDATGFEVLVSTPEQYAAFTRSEIEKWAKAVKASGACAD